jgi:hypothetical protein
MGTKKAKVPGRSILTGVDALIDQALLLDADISVGRKPIGSSPHHKHIESCLVLAGKPVSPAAITQLLIASYEQIRMNWNQWHRAGSDKNWRWEPKKLKDPNNLRPETVLEKHIVNLSPTLFPDVKDWTNQVPVAAGLTSAKDDNGRHIDLVHDCGGGTYEFIELKVRDSNPLFAAMEILKYGLLYVLCRENEDVLTKHQKVKNGRLLGAGHIHLCVLAPPSYYVGRPLATFEANLNQGIQDFVRDANVSFGLDFKFQSYGMFSRVDAY